MTSEQLTELLLGVVADRTGYPPEMLNMEMELEGDLGIDSIKRVEILSAMQDEVPELPEFDTAVMAELVTMGQIVDYMLSEVGSDQVNAADGGGTPPFDRGLASANTALKPAAGLSRYITVAQPAAAAGVRLASITSSKVAIIDDGGGVAPELAALLRTEGVHVAVVDRLADEADFSGVIHLRALSEPSGIEHAQAINRHAFETARALARSTSSADFFITVSGLGGSFGLDGDAANPDNAWRGGLTGLTRTAALEWPDCTVRAFDIERGHRDTAAIAATIASELLTGGTEPEVGLRADGSRLVLTSVEEPVIESPVDPTGGVRLNSSDVVVVSGGARGVTATTMIELARVSGATFVLLGRSVLADEPASCADAHTDGELKKALLSDAVAAGEKIDPKELAWRAGSVLAGREVRATLAAMAAVGAKARYLAVDITDRAAVVDAFETVRATDGSITGVVHGAGVLADKLIAEQSDEAFDKVFTTKVTGLQVLLDATAADSLKVLCLFSSVAARSGNRGQVAYAMANEVLNKVASAERARRGSSCVVKALGWGPWDGGMVTPTLKAHFDEMGVSLIGLQEGANALVAELSSPQVDQVEIVLGGGVLGGGVLGSQDVGTDQ